MKKNMIINYLVLFFSFLIIFFLFYFLFYKLVNYFFKQNIEGFEEHMQKQKQNIILFGDSILNNTSYVKKEESIHQLLLNKIASSSNLYYMPKDNSVISDVYDQFATIPADLDNTYFFLSIGGNDILNGKEEIKNLFFKYITLIKAIQTRFPTSKLFLLNIYLPPTVTPAQELAIREWNSLLYDFATDLKNNIKSLIVINYKLNQKEDFINDIEPSFQGGQKIVEILLKTLKNNS